MRVPDTPKDVAKIKSLPGELGEHEVNAFLTHLAVRARRPRHQGRQ